MSEKIPLLVLAGPTAAGKSALAMRLAPLLETDIISADSAQVYRGLDIGTAKPTAEEQRLVRHHLIDLVDPDEDYSVADYQRDARRVIKELWSRGRLPFLVGGTGLYLQAVIDNYAFGKSGGDKALRERLAAEAEAEGVEALHERLKNRSRGGGEDPPPRPAPHHQGVGSLHTGGASHLGAAGPHAAARITLPPAPLRPNHAPAAAIPGHRGAGGDNDGTGFFRGGPGPASPGLLAQRAGDAGSRLPAAGRLH